VNLYGISRPGCPISKRLYNSKAIDDTIRLIRTYLEVANILYRHYQSVSLYLAASYELVFHGNHSHTHIWYDAFVGFSSTGHLQKVGINNIHKERCNDLCNRRVILFTPSQYVSVYHEVGRNGSMN
jgi:hypothetical protein